MSFTPSGPCASRSSMQVGRSVHRQTQPADALRGYRPAVCRAATGGAVSVCRTARPARGPAGGAPAVGVVGARRVPGLAWGQPGAAGRAGSRAAGAATAGGGRGPLAGTGAEPLSDRKPAALGAGRDARRGRLSGADRRGPPVLAALQNVVLALLRRRGVQNVAAALRAHGWRAAGARHFLGLAPASAEE